MAGKCFSSRNELQQVSSKVVATKTIPLHAHTHQLITHMTVCYNAIRNMFGSGFKMKIERRHDKTNKMIVAPSEDSDQHGHPPSLIRVFAFRLKQYWVLSYPLSAQRRLIGLGGCLGWSESSLDSKVILLVLSWGGSDSSSSSLNLQHVCISSICSSAEPKAYKVS